MATNNNVKTRSATKTKLSQFVGPGKDFLISEVPTWRSVIQKGIQLRNKKWQEDGVSKNLYSVNDMCRELSELIHLQWKKANAKFVPPIIIDEKHLARRIKTKWTKVNNISLRKYSEKTKKEIAVELDVLCDITMCKHPIYSCNSEDSNCKGCSQKVHIKCDCISTVKIPLIELEWLYFQRLKTNEVSKIQIAALDIKTSKKEEEKLCSAAKRFKSEKDRKEKEEKEREERFKMVNPTAKDIDSSDLSDDSERQEDDISVMEPLESPTG